MKRALIFGRAQGVWDEVTLAHTLGAYDHIIGVGSAAVDYPHEFDHWVSFHSIMFPHWLEQRARKGFPQPRQLWSAKYKGIAPVPTRMAPAGIPVSYIWCEGGSSGFIAEELARTELACERIVLAGIPMQADRGQYDTTGPWEEALKHRAVWEQNLDKLQGKVRSFSGWTKDVLGEPTRAWLIGGD